MTSKRVFLKKFKTIAEWIGYGSFGALGSLVLVIVFVQAHAITAAQYAALLA